MTKDLITGSVEKVLIAAKANSIVSAPLDRVKVTFEGFEGDKHSGWTKPSDGRTKCYPRGTLIRNSRQISIVSLEELYETARDLKIPELLPEWFGANLLISGVENLSGLQANSRMLFSGGVSLLVTDENDPCMLLTKEICSHFSDRPELENLIIKTSMHKRGLVAVVELPGEISEGETVQILKSN